MTEKLRSQLGQIDAWLQEDGGLRLWNVLTGLRGPDWTNDPVDHRKLATASVVRRVAFPECAQWGSNGAFYEKDCQSHVTTRKYMNEDTTNPSHYREHAQMAFDALGLKWDSVNS
jgi:hypothetical protein